MEWQATLYITFVDFKKRESYGVPRKIIHIFEMLYENSECAVLDEGEESEWFKVRTGVRQGYVMPGFIFLWLWTG